MNITWKSVTDDDLTEGQEQLASALVDLSTEAHAGQASSVLYGTDEQVIGNVTVAKVWKTPVIWAAFAYDTETGGVVTATSEVDDA